MLLSKQYWGGGVVTPLKSAKAREAEINTVFGEAILAGKTNDSQRVDAVKAEIARMQKKGEDPVASLEWEDSAAAAFIDGGSGAAQKKAPSLFERFCAADDS